MALLQSASLAVGATGENTAVAAVTGSQILVYRAVILNSPATAQVVTVKDKASGNTLAVLPLPLSVGGGLVLGNGDTGQAPVFRTQTSGDLIFSLSAATTVNGFIQYEVR